MIKEARGFGNTIDEAKEQAIANLNAADDADIQFEVIATPKKKTLGLFGGRQAEVRVYVELPDRPAHTKKTVKPAKPNRDHNEPKQKNAGKPKNTEKKNDEKPQAAEKAKPVSEKPAAQKESPLADYGEAIDAAALEPDSKEARAVAYLKNILEKLGCTDISVKVAKKENAALILLDGEGLGVVIGRRGETLDSLQYLTSLAANNGGGYYKITINIGNYREKREETLIALANRVAAQVLESGKGKSLEPMNPYERRVIHTAIQAIEGVESSSYGEGDARRVFISIEGSDQRPPKNDRRRRDGRDDRRRGGNRRRDSQRSNAVSAPTREPKRDSDTPLYGKIN